MTTTDKTTFRFVSMSYNGAQTAGTVFSGVGFNVDYPPTNPLPQVISVLFNGVNVCSGKLLW